MWEYVVEEMWSLYGFVHRVYYLPDGSLFKLLLQRNGKFQRIFWKSFSINQKSFQSYFRTMVDHSSLTV